MINNNDLLPGLGDDPQDLLGDLSKVAMRHYAIFRQSYGFIDREPVEVFYREPATDINYDESPAGWMQTDNAYYEARKRAYTLNVNDPTILQGLHRYVDELPKAKRRSFVNGIKGLYAMAYRIKCSVCGIID